MKRVQFPVSTGLCVILAVLAFFRAVTQGLIPPLPANRLINEPGAYLQQAAHQPVDWRPLGHAAFAEAISDAKPTLLVIGAPWSQTARNADYQVFENLEAANFINQNFVPIRVDGEQKPAWLSSFLPLTRLDVDFSVGFQAFVLDTHGRLLSYISPFSNGQDIDQTSFTDSLVAARRLFASSELGGQAPQLAQAQQSDADQLESGANASSPSFAKFAEALLDQRAGKQAGFAGGGFLQGGVPRILPMAWLFEARTGRVGDMESSLDPILRSPATDIVRGGFFGLLLSNGRIKVDFDEITTRNAEMAALLAEANATNPQPLYDRMAHDTFDMLIRDLRRHDLFDACRQSDQGQRSRSASASFPAKRMADILPGDQSPWAEQHLGLRVLANPQMVPYYTDRSVLGDPMLPKVLTSMRAAHSTPTVNAGAAALDVNGHTAAELLRCGRLWGDRSRMDEADQTVDALAGFHAGSDVVHLKDTTDPGTYLGDYLAYADALLEEYLCYGRSPSFDLGLKVLERSMDAKTFQGDADGEFVTALRSSEPLLPEDFRLPQVSDDVQESCTAQMIRLLEDYGRLLPPGAQSRHLLATAAKVAFRYSGVNEAMSPKMAGYYVSAGSVMDPQCAFAVGLQAQALADALFRLRPARLVAAAYGSVRPDLQGRKPGVYLNNGGIIAGPYSVEQAAALMPQELQLGVNSF